MKERWISSSQKLRSTRYLSVMAMMIAVKIVLSNFYIPIGENLHVSVTFLVVAVEAAIMGPAAGMVSGAVTDIVSFMIHPNGAFFVGYTITAMLGELFYALFFYERRISVLRIVAAKIVIDYGINVALGSLWSAILYSKGYLYYAGKSLIKNTIMLPFEVLALWAVFRFLLPFLKKKGLVSQRTFIQ